MSFHIEFAAASAGKAKDTMAVQHAPMCVKVFVAAAIEGARRSVGGDSAVYLVKATGHLCDDGESYSVSNAQIEVRAFPL